MKISIYHRLSCEKRAPGAHVLVGESTLVPRWIAWKVCLEDGKPLVPVQQYKFKDGHGSVRQ